MVPGMASIEQRGDKHRVVWRTNGRKRSATFSRNDRAESALRLVEARSGKITSDEVYRAILGIDTTEEAPPTVSEWASQWIIERRQLGDVQSDTIDAQYRTIVRRILPRLGQLPVSTITPEIVRNWVMWLAQQESAYGGKIAPLTVRKAHATLHSLLGAAVPRWLPYNPAGRQPGQRRAAGLPKVDKHEPVFLTPTEVEMLLAACPATIRDMAFVAVRTGLRLGEQIVLQVQDVEINRRRKVIHVRRALKRGGKIGAPKSRRSSRDVSVSGEVAQVLARLVAGKRPTDLVFTASEGGRWNPANLRGRYWVPAVARARRCAEHLPPLPEKARTGPRRALRPDEVSTCACRTRLHRVPRWHDLRHTHASLCVEAGWDIVKVSRRLGHESIKTTVDIYGHLWDRDPAEQLDALEKLLSENDWEVDEDDEAA